jgi:HSP20 family protein
MYSRFFYPYWDVGRGDFRNWARRHGISYSEGMWFPVDVKLDGDSFVINAYLPSVKAEDLQVTVGEDSITVDGQTTYARESQDRYLASELPSGHFGRTFHLGESLDPSSAEATLSDGLLTLRVRKATTAREHTVRVEVK